MISLYFHIRKSIKRKNSRFPLTSTLLLTLGLLCWEIKDNRRVGGRGTRIKYSNKKFNLYNCYFFVGFIKQKCCHMRCKWKSHFHMDYVWNACYITWAERPIFSTLNICMNFNENQFFFKNIRFESWKCGNNYWELTPFTFCEVVIVVEGVRKLLDELLCS